MIESTDFEVLEKRIAQLDAEFEKYCYDREFVYLTRIECEREIDMYVTKHPEYADATKNITARQQVVRMLNQKKVYRLLYISDDQKN